MKMTIDLVPEAIRPYVGLRFHTHDSWQRAEQMRFSFASECLCDSRSPQGLLARNGVLLNELTRDYLYQGSFGHVETAYVAGTWPLLERYIGSLVTQAMSDAEKVVTISQSLLYELPRRHPPSPVFLYGESDQEVLLKGGGHCTCKARLLCACCQILGVSARPVLQWTWRDRSTAERAAKVRGGHTIVEVLLQGRWSYFDPEYHLYCADSAGRFFSIDEIRHNPDLFRLMPADIVEQMSPRHFGAEQGEESTIEYYWRLYLDPRGPTQISRHDTMQPYLGRWFWATNEALAGLERDMQVNETILHRLAERGELSEDIYQMGIDAFRRRFAIEGGALKSQASHDFAGRARTNFQQGYI